MEIRPIRDLILCEVLDSKPKQTPGGVLLPDSQVGREDRARVLAVGAGGLDKKGRRVRPSVRPGDVVTFDPYRLEWAAHNGTVSSVYARPGEQMLIREQHIYGVVQ